MKIKKKENGRIQSNSKCTCKCTKIGCNQKYCLCFAHGEACNSGCRCINCTNKNILKKNTNILKPKKIKCSCSKTGCLKKYCECYKAGKHCNESCRCRDCDNIPRENLPATVEEASNDQNSKAKEDNNIIRYNVNKESLKNEENKIRKKEQQKSACTADFLV